MVQSLSPRIRNELNELDKVDNFLNNKGGLKCEIAVGVRGRRYQLLKMDANGKYKKIGGMSYNQLLVQTGNIAKNGKQLHCLPKIAQDLRRVGEEGQEKVDKINNPFIKKLIEIIQKIRNRNFDREATLKALESRPLGTTFQPTRPQGPAGRRPLTKKVHVKTQKPVVQEPIKKEGQEVLKGFAKKELKTKAGSAHKKDSIDSAETPVSNIGRSTTKWNFFTRGWSPTSKVKGTKYGQKNKPPVKPQEDSKNKPVK